jgi:Glycosyltransferase like family
VIAFGCSVAEAEAYRRYAGPGIERAAEPDSAVYPFAAVGSTARTYNLLLDAAAVHDDLEALVLVHPHAEIADPGFCAKVRSALRDQDVAVAGSAGATGVRSIAWWEGVVSSAPVSHRYHEHGGGELPGFSWANPEAPLGEVEVVDGFLMALSPWAVRNLRFDEGLLLGHGFDFDYCMRARSAGRRVVTADLRTVHHRSLELIEDLELWVEAQIKVAEKWDGHMPGVAPDGRSWRERARRAEAAREAARALAYTNLLRSDARVLGLERELDQLEGSLSWRITSPLRRLNRWRAERLGRAGS